MFYEKDRGPVMVPDAHAPPTPLPKRCFVIFLGYVLGDDPNSISKESPQFI